MNLYEASLTEGARSLALGSQNIELPQPVRDAHPGLASHSNEQIVVGLRPEHLPAAVSGATGPTLVGTVDLIEALGSELVVHFTTDARRVRAEGAMDPTEQAGEGVARVDPGTPVTVGQRITFAIRAEGMQFFDAATGDAIWGG
jgi:multiple sugar transport system ATP-binding protein